ncbi:unnamed protein product, partial [Choristocarpus tenellus]
NSLCTAPLQGNYEQADPLYQRSLAIREKVLGPEHLDVAFSLDNRAGLLKAQGYFMQADPLYQRSLAIREKLLGTEHQHVASCLDNRAELLKAQVRKESTQEGSFGLVEVPSSLDFNHSPCSIGRRGDCMGLGGTTPCTVDLQGNYEQADLLYQRSLAITEKVLGPDHPDVAFSLDNWAGLLKAQ